MTTHPTRKPFKITSRVATWKNADGTENEVVRLFGGTRSIAVDFTELPALIRDLQRLHRQQSTAEEYTARLFTD